MAVVVLAAASMLAWVIAPSSASLLAFTPGSVFAGEVWRLFTWPLADGLSLFSLLTLVVFWYFGRELEGQIGRNRMAWFLVGIWGGLTAAGLLVGLAFGGGMVLAGLGQIEFLVLLVWIAEYPRRPLFFGIQAWVVGALLLALQVLGMIAARSWTTLLVLLLGIVVGGIAARRVGLLTDFGWIPGGQRAGAPRTAKVPRAQARAHQRRTSDRDRLDDLLDRISAEGLDSLSQRERKELLTLRGRLRDGR